MLLGGGDMLYTYAKNEKTHPKRFYKKLLKYFNSHFKNIDLKIDCIWPGMLGVTKDLLPVVASDKKLHNVYYVGAATGLPWAAALGNYIVEKITKNRSDYDEFFSPNRKFPINKNFLGKKATFAISHGIVKEII